MTGAKPSPIKSEEKVAVSAGKPDSKHALEGKGPFEKMNKHHTNALGKLLYCHHNNDQALTFQELSAEMAVGEKTKDWQCVAWKDLKNSDYMVSEKRDGKPYYKLTEKGVALATTFATADELAAYKMPESNEEHHERIKTMLMQKPKAKKYGPLTFDFLVANQTPMNRNEIAKHFDVDADSHGFFYGLQALQKMGMLLKTDAPRPPKKKSVKDEDEDEDDKKDQKEGDTEADDEEMDEQDGKKEKKKKGSKTKKNKTGGKLLELSDKAFLATVGRK